PRPGRRAGWARAPASGSPGRSCSAFSALPGANEFCRLRETVASYDPDPPEFQGATSGAVWLLLGGVGLAVGEAAYQADSATNHMVWGWLAGAGVFAVVVAGLLWRSRQRVVASALLVLAISLGIGGWRLR